MTWDQLMNRMTTQMGKCHQISIPGQQDEIRKGEPANIEISVEQRMGNKKMTMIRNLDQYGIDVKEFAKKLQQIAASSTAVDNIPGGKVPKQQVQVQGMQSKHVFQLLDSYRVPKKYITESNKFASKSKR